MPAQIYRATIRIYAPGERPVETIGVQHGAPLGGVYNSRYYPSVRPATLVHRFSGYIDSAFVPDLVGDFSSLFVIDGLATGFP